MKKIYYMNGKYQEENEDIQNYNIRKNHKIKKRVIIIILCIILISVFLKLNVYNSQHAWTEDLIEAINDGNTAEVSKLLEDSSMDINKKGGGAPFPINLMSGELMDDTPFSYAVIMSNFEIIEMLAKHGADTNMGADNTLAFILRGVHGEDEWSGIYHLVKILLANGAEPDGVEGELDNNPLMAVASMQVADGKKVSKEKMRTTVELYQLIYKHCEEKTPYDHITKTTPLHAAAENGNIELVRHLIEETHADIYAEDTDGKTAYEYALEADYSEVAEFLKP